jgi:hypothetical protein
MKQAALSTFHNFLWFIYQNPSVNKFCRLHAYKLDNRWAIFMHLNSTANKSKKLYITRNQDVT